MELGPAALAGSNWRRWSTWRAVAYEELAEVYEAMRRMVERGYLEYKLRGKAQLLSLPLRLLSCASGERET